jgi:putative ABC transport system ATP-binding protein
MITLANISKTFNAGRQNEFTAVKGINLSIAMNTITVLKGPSGSGKTTLLSIIGCMARPTAGRITVQEREITSLPERFLTEIRRNTFGFVFQNFNLIKGVTVLENVMFPAFPAGIRHAELQERAMRLLEKLKIASKARQNVESLSGGEQQRTAIARALINEPAVIIADEPTAHLDTELSGEFMDTMAGLHAEGKTILIASHDPLMAESENTHRVIELRDGQIIGEH